MIDSLKKRGLKIIGDPASITVVLDRFESSFSSLKEGYFLFIDNLKQPSISFVKNYHLQARAICFLKIDDQYYAHIDIYNISNLISSRSNYLEDGIKRKASKLYGIPLNKVDNEEWNNLKFQYLNSNVIGRLIQITACDIANSVDWKFVNSPDDLSFLNNYKKTAAMTNFEQTEVFQSLSKKFKL